MKKLLPGVAALLFFAACTNNTDTKEKEKVSEEVTQPTEVTETEKLERSFPDLFAYLDKEDTAFASDRFVLSSENKLDTLPAAPLTDEQWNNFKNLFVYNSDSTKAIDLYSYNYILTRRNGNTKMEEAGPDTEVKLVDVKAKTGKRIFFSGPSYPVWEAKWLSENEIALAGAEMLENGEMKPTIWQINLSDAATQVFTYDGTLTVNMKAYMDKKTAIPTAVKTSRGA